MCDKSLSAIKAHPYGILLDNNSSYYKLRYKQLIQRCKLGGLELFDKTIFIARDPVTAIWAEFHLYVSGSHTGNFKHFPDDRFSKWREFALNTLTRLQSDWDSLIYPFKVKHPDDTILVNFDNMLNSSPRGDELKKLC